MSVTFSPSSASPSELTINVTENAVSANGIAGSALLTYEQNNVGGSLVATWTKTLDASGNSLDLGGDSLLTINVQEFGDSSTFILSQGTPATIAQSPGGTILGGGNLIFVFAIVPTDVASVVIDLALGSSMCTVTFQMPQSQ